MFPALCVGVRVMSLTWMRVEVVCVEAVMKKNIFKKSIVTESVVPRDVCVDRLIKLIKAQAWLFRLDSLFRRPSGTPQMPEQRATLARVHRRIRCTTDLLQRSNPMCKFPLRHQPIASTDCFLLYPVTPRSASGWQ